MTITEIPLHQEVFARDRRVLLKSDGIVVTAFRFSSGVAALEVDTGAARFVPLPFQGQQIWDAWVGNRRLTMQSVFDAPLPVREFRRTYGAFFLHCGATAMGSPQPGESYPPHGELPNVSFDTAVLRTGQGREGSWVELSGVAHDREAFSHFYAFRPRLRFASRSSIVDASIELENLGGADMPLMYLGHVNFRPVPGSEIIDRNADDGRRWSKPQLPEGTAAPVDAWHDAVSKDYSRHRRIGADDRVEPEFVATLTLPAEADGWAHSLQLLPDGTSDFVSYRPQELPFGVRWMTRAPERQALGLILPATAGPEGRAAAAAAGHLRTLCPGEIFSAHIKFGALDKEQSRAFVELLRR